MRMKNTTLGLIMAITLLFNINLQAKEEKIPFKIGVNRFAWYASLQTINFMPLIVADPFAGVILTDWYSINGVDRYKVDVYILEENLTANTVQVKIFKQKKVGNSWGDVNASQEIATKIEDSILNKARELRIEYIIGNK